MSEPDVLLMYNYKIEELTHNHCQTVSDKFKSSYPVTVTI